MALTFKTGEVPDEFTQHLISAKPVKGNLTIHHKSGSEDEKLVSAEEETVHPGVMIPPDQLYVLRVEGGATVKTAPYETAKIGVSLQVPCKKDDLDHAYEWALDWIDQKITKAVKQVKG